MENNVITVHELAKMLRIGLNSAYRLVRSGTIPSVRIGRQFRIPLQGVQRYLQENPSDCA